MKRRNYVAVAIILVVAVIAVIVVWNRPGTEQPSVISLPSPNGYDDFIAAERLLVVPTHEWWRGDKDLTVQTARVYVSSNAPSLSRIGKALSNEWWMPLGFSTNWFQNHISHELPNSKRIGHLFSLEGYVAEQEGRYGDAAESYLNGIGFGARVARGGVVIDTLVGIAIQNVEFGPLENIIDKIDATECKSVVGQLHAAETNYESFTAVLDREKLWSKSYEREFYGTARALLFSLREMISSKSLHPEAAALQRAGQRYEAALLRLRSLQVRFAVRTFRLEHGTDPKGWGDLVPRYLPAVPVDPQTQRPLTHQF